MPSDVPDYRAIGMQSAPHSVADTVPARGGLVTSTLMSHVWLPGGPGCLFRAGAPNPWETLACFPDSA